MIKILFGVCYIVWGWGGSSGYENDNIKVLLILVFSIIFLIFCDVFNLFLCCRY